MPLGSADPAGTEPAGHAGSPPPRSRRRYRNRRKKGRDENDPDNSRSLSTHLDFPNPSPPFLPARELIADTLEKKRYPRRKKNLGNSRLQTKDRDSETHVANEDQVWAEGQPSSNPVGGADQGWATPGQGAEAWETPDQEWSAQPALGEEKKNSAVLNVNSWQEWDKEKNGEPSDNQLHGQPGNCQESWTQKPYSSADSTSHQQRDVKQDRAAAPNIGNVGREDHQSGKEIYRGKRRQPRTTRNHDSVGRGNIREFAKQAAPASSSTGTQPLRKVRPFTKVAEKEREGRSKDNLERNAFKTETITDLEILQEELVKANARLELEVESRQWMYTLLKRTEQELADTKLMLYSETTARNVAEFETATLRDRLRSLHALRESEKRALLDEKTKHEALERVCSSLRCQLQKQNEDQWNQNADASIAAHQFDEDPKDTGSGQRREE